MWVRFGSVALMACTNTTLNERVVFDYLKKYYVTPVTPVRCYLCRTEHAECTERFGAIRRCSPNLKKYSVSSVTPVGLN